MPGTNSDIGPDYVNDWSGQEPTHVVRQERSETRSLA